jgi:hypothetical protein
MTNGWSRPPYKNRLNLNQNQKPQRQADGLSSDDGCRYNAFQ